MGSVTPLIKVKKIVKRKKKFERLHNDRHMRVGASWRKPRGIDCAMRRRFRGERRMVTIGSGTNKKHRHILPNGFKKFRVNNVGDLNVLLMHNRKYAAEIAHGVSRRKRKEIVARAAELNVKVLNAEARLTQEENE